MARIRVLLIEDNRILRDGITDMLEKRAHFAVVSISDGREASLARARSAKPDLVLLDLGLGSQDSLEAVGTIGRIFPGARIIGMGLAPAQADIMEFVQAGAHGFILKSATVDEVIGTMRIVAGGETVLPPTMTGSLFSQVVEHALSKGKRNLRNAARMTKREKEVIAAIVEGMSNKQIADKLGIATFTVKSHIHNIMEKLALHSRLQIARHAGKDPQA